MHNRHAIGAIVALLSATVAGCGADGAPEGTADVSLELAGTSNALADTESADAPQSMVRSAMVTIDRIYLEPAEGVGNDRVVLRDTPVTTDLLTLASDTAMLVDGAIVPAGRYGEIRFIIRGAYLDVAGEGLFATPDYDGIPPGATVTGTLKTPSLDTSGLKIKLPSDDLFDSPGLQQILLARFDVAESFGHAAGDGWVMHPVIEATALETTAHILLRIDASPVIDVNAPLAGEPWVAVLWDRDGFVEVATDLVPEAQPGLYTADFPYLLTSEGPYTITLQTAAGVVVTTNPPLPAELPVPPEADLDVEVTAIHAGL